MEGTFLMPAGSQKESQQRRGSLWGWPHLFCHGRPEEDTSGPKFLFPV